MAMSMIELKLQLKVAWTRQLMILQWLIDMMIVMAMGMTTMMVFHVILFLLLMMVLMSLWIIIGQRLVFGMTLLPLLVVLFGISLLLLVVLVKCGLKDEQLQMQLFS